MANFGVILPTTNNEQTPGKLIDFAIQAEELGYDSLWVGDTLLRPVLEPLATLAAVSSVTSRVTLGTAALLPAFRTPVQAAQALASLDLLSGGRLTVTVGAGFPGRSEPEYEMSGVPWAGRFTRLDETVQLWRRLWTSDEPVSFHGEVLRLDDIPPVARPHGPKIWLGGATPRALARTGALYDGWLPYPPDPADYASGLAVRDSADHGRPQQRSEGARRVHPEQLRRPAGHRENDPAAHRRPRGNRARAAGSVPRRGCGAHRDPDRGPGHQDPDGATGADR
jgi:alkanesulfonate monooxygenase SsuD/methylene tetrahydromethanopterin reductase-like flavin-dependent oxidoreductase (luciferase family)